MALCKQQIGKLVPATTNTSAIVAVGNGFSSRSIQSGYTEDNWSDPIRSRVEAGSNTYTIALRVVGGKEKGTQCLGIQPGHPVPEGYKYRGLALHVEGVSNLRQ
jgi:hypothetical protein